MKFRKKPVVIEAMQFTGGNLDEWRAFVPVLGGDERLGYQRGIRTLEGIMVMEEGDWIVKGVAGEFYPVKPEIFALTYESVEP